MSLPESVDVLIVGAGHVRLAMLTTRFSQEWRLWLSAHSSGTPSATSQP